MIRVLHLAGLVLATLPTSAQHDDRSSARALGLDGPVTVEQGAIIATHHTGAETVQFLEQEEEDGVLLYEYLVKTASGELEVEVGQEDGAVLEVEPAEDESYDDRDGEDD